MTEFLTAAQAAQRLGVKPATLYAYVSRGVLRRDRAGDGRGSLFDSEEVERLARRGRPRRPAGVADITVESAITEITGDRLRYRGLDVIRLATSRTFEDVAELLWTGEFSASPGGRPPQTPPHAQPPGQATASTPPQAPVPPQAPAPWQATPAALAAGRAAQAALPAGTLPLERFQVIVPAMAATDPLRLQLDPAAVVAAGRSIIAGLVDCLPPAAQPPAASDYPISDYPSADYPTRATRTRATRTRATRTRATRTRATRSRTTRSQTGCGRGCVTAGPARCSGAPCRPRWSCWPTTSSPRPPWPRGPPRRSARIRTPSSPPGWGRWAARCTAGRPSAPRRC